MDCGLWSMVCGLWSFVLRPSSILIGILMYLLSIETHFSAAHCLKGYAGNCARMHGHNWKVRVSVSARELDELGMGIDFRTLRGYVDEVVGRLDHQNLSEVPPFDALNPTSEHLARYIFTTLKKKLGDGRIEVRAVEVWESERYSVRYSEE